jgi:hypothetical protein
MQLRQHLADGGCAPAEQRLAFDLVEARDSSSLAPSNLASKACILLRSPAPSLASRARALRATELSGRSRSSVAAFGLAPLPRAAWAFLPASATFKATVLALFNPGCDTSTRMMPLRS